MRKPTIDKPIVVSSIFPWEVTLVVHSNAQAECRIPTTPATKEG